MLHEYQNSLLSNEKTFRSVFPQSNKIQKPPSQLPIISQTFTPPVEPKVEIGVSAISTKVKEKNYNYFRPLMVILLLSVFAVAVSVGVWIFYRTYNTSKIKAGSSSPTQQIDNFMASLQYGLSNNYGTASSIISPADCNAQNNCIVTGSNFNCLVNNGLRQWNGNYCQIPSITSPWVVSLLKGDESLLGTQVSSGVGFPTDVSELFIEPTPIKSALVYYNTDVTINNVVVPKKTYKFFNQTGVITNTNIVNFYQLTQDSNTLLAPFVDYTRSRLIYVKNLQNVYYGPNQARIVFSNVPSLYEFIYGGENVQILQPGIPYNVSKPYSIYNINSLMIKITGGGMVSEFNSQFVPMTTPNGVTKIEIVI